MSKKYDEKGDRLVCNESGDVVMIVFRLIIAGLLIRLIMIFLQWESERQTKKKTTESIYNFDMRCPMYVCGLGSVCGIMCIAILIGIYVQEGYVHIVFIISMGIMIILSLYAVFLPIPRMWDQRVEQDEVTIRRFIIYEKRWNISNITYCKMTKGGMLKVYVKGRKRMAFSVDPLLIGKRNFIKRMKKENVIIYDAEGKIIN